MNPNYTAITRCRISGNRTLVCVLDLGNQALTGVFPKTRDAAITSGPLKLVWCPDSGLLQLAHSYNIKEMYGDNYGYRSGLNRSMVDHLTHKINILEHSTALSPGDTVLDIGSNDATLLKAYRTPSLTRIGIDPTGSKFRQYYPDEIILVPDFFSTSAYYTTGAAPAKIITSIAMFYDLEDPIKFAREVEFVLAPHGIWHFEQGYMPSMLRLASYDTVCHEHLEYYSFSVVAHILAEAGMRAIDVSINNINGGSFAVTAARRDDQTHVVQPTVPWLLEQEDKLMLNTSHPYRKFEDRVNYHRADLKQLLKTLAAANKKVIGYGASTKGNVVLQFCGIGPSLVSCIAEVNEEKFGSFTPGTGIPIVSEKEARAMQPDYFLVMPWHFRDGIVQREAEFLARGGHMIFPFPNIEIV